MVQKTTFILHYHRNGIYISNKYYSEEIPWPPHKDEHMVLDIDLSNILKCERNKNLAFIYLLEVYIDDFIAPNQSMDK